MKRTFKFEGLCCANCAQKIEDGINKIDGVNSAKVVFMTERLKLDADDARWEQILDEAQAVCTKYEDDCVIVR